MKTKINVVSVPFASKKKLKWLSNSKKNKRSVEGIAYFIFDSNWKECIRQIPYLITGEYRPNDPKMMQGKNGKGTGCWQIIGQERCKIFSSKKVRGNYQIKTLTKEQIQKINQKALKEWTTILTLDKWLSGSNPSGSEMVFKSTPYLTNIQKYPKLTELIFINCFKKINAKRKRWLPLTDWKQLKEQAISFQDFFEKEHCPKFNLYFNVYNDALMEPATEKTNQEKEIEQIYQFYFEQKQTTIKQKKLLQEYKEKNKQNIWSFQNKQNRYSVIENQKQQKSLINKLRRSFIVSLWIEKKIQKISQNSYIDNDQIYEQSNLEGAHIYPVHKAETNNEFEIIGDYQNGLLMSANLHRSYDNGAFYFNEQGRIILKQENKNILTKKKFAKLKIKEQILTSERKEYLRKYSKKFRANRINLVTTT